MTKNPRKRPRVNFTCWLACRTTVDVGPRQRARGDGEPRGFGLRSGDCRGSGPGGDAATPACADNGGNQRACFGRAAPPAPRQSSVRQAAPADRFEPPRARERGIYASSASAAGLATSRDQSAYSTVVAHGLPAQVKRFAQAFLLLHRHEWHPALPTPQRGPGVRRGAAAGDALAAGLARPLPLL